MKRCPVCHTEYPNEQNFCVRDGSNLVKAPPPTREVAAPFLAKLTIRPPDGEVREVALSQSVLSIGSSAENDLVIADIAVSRRHAIIQRQGEQWQIQDAGSRNGVFVNGHRVGPSGQRLRSGDVVEIGQTNLIFSLNPAAADSPPVKAASAPPPPAAPPPAQPPSARRVAPESGKAAARRAGLGKGVVLDERYELEAEIDRDLTSTLYRARRIRLGDQVAVRVLRPELVKEQMPVDLFRRRAQVAARIHHPNAVQIYDFGVSPEGHVYLVEELLAGRTLRDLVREERGLTLQRIVRMFNQICGAVHAAHLHGIVLRDVRPESIFLEPGPDGEELIKVGSSGLAKLDVSTSGGGTVAGQAMMLGSPHYMSPEQWLGHPLDSRADVYALGVILFELLTGAVPFDGKSWMEISRAHLHAPVPDLAEFGRPDLDDEMVAVVNRALSKNPLHRPPTALYLASELQAAASGPGGIFGRLLQKATGVMPAAPVVIPRERAPAGEAALPSVIAEAEAKGGGALNPLVLALMAEAFLSRLSSGLIKTAVPLFALLVFGLDITSVMALVLIQNIVPLLLRPLFGTLADRYGKKRIFLISLVIRTAVSLLYAIATLPLLFVVSAIRGIADSAKGPSASAMIADHTDEKHIARAYSWYTTTKSTSGGIGEALAAFLLVTLVVFMVGRATVTVNVAVLDAVTKAGTPVEEFLKSPDEVAIGQTWPGTGSKVLRIEQRERPLGQIPIDRLPKVVDAALLRKALVAIFLVSTLLSALSFLLVLICVKEKEKEKTKKKEKKAGGLSAGSKPGQLPQQPEPNVWAFALLGTALTAPAYMVTGEFFVVLAVKLEVTPNALGWIKILAETVVPLTFGPFFGWLADRIGAGKVIALRSVANLSTSALFWITPWFVGSVLLGLLIGLARGVDEIGKAAFKPTWGAVAAKVSSFNLANRSKTMGILEGGIDAADLTFPLLAGLLFQYFSLGVLMAGRAVLALMAEVYAHLLMRKYRI